MAFFKKYRLEILIFIAISTLYFLTRLHNILGLPIFTDEAIYVRWAQIAKNDANWRFISLTDGKQPMFVWLAMVFMKFIKDPLFAGRIVSVFSGFFSMVGLYFLGRELFKNRLVGLLSSCLYLLYSFGLVYDRMALYDSLVGAFAIWGLYLEVLLVRRIRLDIAFLSALVVGGGMLTKTNAFFNIYFLPLTLWLFDFKSYKKVERLFKWIGLAILVVVLSILYYSVLRLSPFFHIIDEKNALFVYPFKEWILHPFTFFLGNLFIGQWDWLMRYVTLPILFLVVLSIFIERKFLQEKILLLFWFLVPFLYLALFGKTIYPRHILFMTLFLLPLAAFSLKKISEIVKNKFLFSLLLIFCIVFQVRSDYYILFDFAHAPIPVSDLNQYNNDWPAGQGISESIQFFKEKSKNQKILIATQGTFGMMPAAYEIYLKDNRNIQLQGYWPIEDTIPSALLEKSKKMPVFIVFHEPCAPCEGKGLAPVSWKLSPVFQFQKTAPYAYLTVYQIKP